MGRVVMHYPRPRYSIDFYRFRQFNGKMFTTDTFVVTEHFGTKESPVCRVGKRDMRNQLLLRGIPLTDVESLVEQANQLVSRKES